MKRKIFLSSLFLSLLFHGWFLTRVYQETLPENADENQAIRVVLQDSKTKRQIVESEDPDQKIKSQKERYLSDKNRNFARETVASQNGSFKQAGQGNKKAQKSQNQQKSKKQKKQKSPTLADLSVGKAVPKRYQMKEEKDQQKKRQMAALGLENGIEKETGLSKSNDYIEDVPLGDMTKLNTQEYKFYGFYYRIKQKLEQHWGTSLQEKADRLMQKGKRLPASEKRLTALRVTLDDKGQIVRIKVKSSSGLHELDDAAIESFNKAGPFPNPPKEMVESGKADIEWAFVVSS